VRKNKKRKEKKSSTAKKSTVTEKTISILANPGITMIKKVRVNWTKIQEESSRK
jgi:hypothetical protein